MFEYLAAKIENAAFQDTPFRHIHVEEFFSPEHLSAIISSQEIDVARCDTDSSLIDMLTNIGYRPIDFPGTTTNLDAYLKWHANRQHGTPNGSTTERDLCEGAGVTLRLQSAKTGIIGELIDFLASDRWLDAISGTFGIDRGRIRSDNGIHKYLDGYEISPHPDVRSKALTYMVNINPSATSPDIDYHTHYMKFASDYRYVQTFWETNLDLDRCWVPWHWCDTVKQQSRNNTLVMFQPSDDTLHAVKAAYDHLVTQRTQLYGNLWYTGKKKTIGKPSWRDLDIRSRTLSRASD